MEVLWYEQKTKLWSVSCHDALPAFDGEKNDCGDRGTQTRRSPEHQGVSDSINVNMNNKNKTKSV